MPQLVPAVFVEPVDEASEMMQAPTVNPAEARAWVLYPRGNHVVMNTKGERRTEFHKGVYDIKGFYIRADEQGLGNEFKVVDAQHGVAVERGYTKQLGLITVAFYTPADKESRGGTRGLVSALGREYREQLHVYQGNNVPGNLLGVVSIQYGQP